MRKGLRAEAPRGQVLFSLVPGSAASARQTGEAWGKPASGDERYLADKLVAVGRSATEALVQVEGLSAAEAFSQLRALVQGWAGVAHNSIIEKVQYNEQQEMNAQATRMKRIKASK